MFWLALATALLLWSAFTAASRRPDGATALSLIILTMLSLGAVRVYPARTEAASLICGTVAAASILWLLGSRAARWSRWAALFVALAAGLFSIFGPAQGLFA